MSIWFFLKYAWAFLVMSSSLLIFVTPFSNFFKDFLYHGFVLCIWSRQYLKPLGGVRGLHLCGDFFVMCLVNFDCELKFGWFLISEKPEELKKPVFLNKNLHLLLLEARGAPDQGLLYPLVGPNLRALGLVPLLCCWPSLSLLRAQPCCQHLSSGQPSPLGHAFHSRPSEFLVRQTGGIWSQDLISCPLSDMF